MPNAPGASTRFSELALTVAVTSAGFVLFVTEKVTTEFCPAADGKIGIASAAVSVTKFAATTAPVPEYPVSGNWPKAPLVALPAAANSLLLSKTGSA